MARLIIDLRKGRRRRSAPFSKASAGTPPSTLGIAGFGPENAHRQDVVREESSKKLIDVHLEVIGGEAGRLRPPFCCGAATVAATTVSVSKKWR